MTNANKTMLMDKILDLKEKIAKQSTDLKKEIELKNKENLVEKIYNQVDERLKIIEKAETNDLKKFLKENDVYAIFENGKFDALGKAIQKVTGSQYVHAGIFIGNNQGSRMLLTHLFIEFWDKIFRNRLN